MPINLSSSLVHKAKNTPCGELRTFNFKHFLNMSQFNKNYTQRVEKSFPEIKAFITANIF